MTDARTFEEQQLARSLDVEAWGQVPLSVDVDAVVRTGQRAVRRRRAIGASVLAAVAPVLVSVAVGWPVSSPPADPAAASEDFVAFYDGADLHLSSGAVEVSGLTRFLVVGDRAVLGLEDGTIAVVGADGRAQIVGSSSDLSDPLIADPASGWVAWVEGLSIREGQELVVYDAAASTEVGRQPLATSGPRFESLDGGGDATAIENGTVYYAAVDGDYAWTPGEGDPERIVAGDDRWLVDVQAGVRLYRERSGGNLIGRVVGPGFQQVIAEDYGRLSPRGRYVLAIDPLDAGKVFDARTGMNLDTGLVDGQYPVEAVFGSDGSVTYAVGRRLRPQPDLGPLVVDPVEGPIDLVTCQITTASCRTVADDVVEQSYDVLLGTGIY